MASENFVQPSIPRFDGHYDHWSMLMENFLRSKEYWQVVDSGVVEPAADTLLTETQRTELNALKLKDLKAKNYLFQAIDRSILETILCKDTSKQIWDSMKKKYQGNARAKRVQLQALRREFEALQMNFGESVSEYFSRATTIANKMRIHGEKLEDVTIVEKILRSMTSKFNFVICSIEESKDIDTLSIDELQSSLLVHEQKITQQDKEEQALQAAAATALQAAAATSTNPRGAASQGNWNRWDNPNSTGHKPSVGQLQEKGYEISIKDGVCQIQDEKLGLIAQVKITTNRMFPLYLHHTTYSCLAAKLENTAWLWHFRYGHLSFGGLKTLQKKDMVEGLPEFVSPSDVCEDCVVSKQHRNSFPKGNAWRAKKALELVHSDLCGPINPTSNGGKRYIITFIDDYSRKTRVYFLQEKSEAFLAFKNYKAHVEKEVGSPIKILRTDRGGEYNSHEFVNFCEIHGIKRQLTAAYTPQQNGVCERKNRTILNMVRSLLTRSGIPKTFWPEAVKWSIHILNRSPTFAVQNMTPEEAWSGRRPAVDYFRIFGCISYAHIPDEKRKKLVDKGEKCIFLGVSDQSKAYKLYNPSTKKIVISRDVVFDEDQTWPWNENGVKQHVPAIGLAKDDEETQMENEQEPAVTPNISQDTQSMPIDVADDVQRPHRARRRPTWMSDYERSMMVEFDMSDLGMMHYFLGIEVKQSAAGIFISQKKYVQEILDRFQMKNCNYVSTPTEFRLKLSKDQGGKQVNSTLYKQIVGSLMYLTTTRPDIMYSVSLISRYMENPTELHLLAAKRIFRYLKGTIDFGLLYKKGEKSYLMGFTDSDYAGDIDDRKSTSGYAFMLGSGAVSWSSKKQPIVTLSTTEAEFVAATSCACQAIWLRKILEELHFKQEEATTIYCDNSSAIKLSKNPVLHGRSKHIDVKVHFLRDLTKEGVIDLIYCRNDQVADIFTKPLKKAAFQKLRKLLGVGTLELN
ncbi:hypothetical protein RJ640_013575 [Escallonia rubra]|uniref:Integrase catalytic domain-containing protein n=1 Tax=Escallonia rubra TaxID=112253 RepID=A0AA88QIL0_9ASTE|nr:hypothetical protein RJ640_013575 [Escallonia rubra]